MATEVLSPDAILAQTALSGTVSAIQDDPDSPDASWITADASTNTAIRVSFPTTTADLRIGSQEFRVLLRYNNTPGSTITYTAELYDSGTSVQVLATTATLSSNGVVSLSWDSTNLNTADGSGVELLISQDGGHTGNPGNRRYLEIGAVEWVANVAEAAQVLTAPHLDDSVDTFYTANTHLSYNIAAPLLDDSTDSLYAPQVTSSYVVSSPHLDDSTDTFYTHSLSARYVLSPEKITDADTLHSATVRSVYSLSVPHLDDSSDTFYAASLIIDQIVEPPHFDDSTDAFYSATIVQDQVLQPPLFDDSTDTFYLPVLEMFFSLQVPKIGSSSVVYAPNIMSDQILSAPLIDESEDVFYVTSLAYSTVLLAQLFSDATETFYTATLAQKATIASSVISVPLGVLGNTVDIHRKGDPNTAGAPVTSTKQGFARVNGKTISTDGDPVASHGDPPHAAPVTASGASWARINGVPINRKGDPDTCGHARSTGATFARISR